MMPDPANKAAMISGIARDSWLKSSDVSLSAHTNTELTFLQLSLALNRRVGEQKGLEPLLSTATYDYGVEIPDWDWDTLGRKVEDVSAEINAWGADPAHAQRVPFLLDLLAAYAVMVRDGMGDAIPYSERVSTMLQVPGHRVEQSVIDQLQADLSELLVEAGYPDDPAVAMARWREGQALFGPALADHGHALLAEAQARTHARVWPMPEGHQVHLFFPTGYPYRGYSDYSRDYQGRVFLSGDIHWELAGLRHLITHEAFPGHQAFSATREARFRAGLMPVEGTLYFSNTPITPIVEGLCEIGQELVGMIETIDDRIYEAHNRLSKAVALNLAFDCNEDGMDVEAAATLLAINTYVPQLFAERYCRFFTHPLWCTSYPHYWNGSEFMHECATKMQHDLPAFFNMVFTQPHSVRTLRAAVDAHVAGQPTEASNRSRL